MNTNTLSYPSSNTYPSNTYPNMAAYPNAATYPNSDAYPNGGTYYNDGTYQHGIGAAESISGTACYVVIRLVWQSDPSRSAIE